MTLVLVNKQGTEVKRGDKAVDFRGEAHVVTGWQEPRHGGSTGRVLVKPLGGKFESEFFPSVFDMAWVERN